MDPVTMILAALAAGVATGAGAAAAQAFKDGYAGLKGLLKRRFAGNAKAHETLADFEADPDTYEKPLAKLLKETGADQDPQILAAAERLVAAAEHAGVRTKYHVSVTGCGQVGAIAGDAQVTVNAPTRPQEPGLAPVQPVGHDSWSAYPRIDVDANREVRPEVVVIDEPFDVVVGLANQDVAITQTGGMRFQVRAGMEVELVLVYDPNSLVAQSDTRLTLKVSDADPFPTGTVSFIAQYRPDLPSERRIGVQYIVGGRWSASPGALSWSCCTRGMSRTRRRPTPGRMP